MVLGSLPGQVRWTRWKAPRDPRPQPAHALGVFILWLGWFGFNPGSTNVADEVDRPHRRDHQLRRRDRNVLGALIALWLLLKKPEMTMTSTAVWPAWSR
ncbi:MAG: hypothetical protein U1F87_18310 [Kiritimatiellia bacterium]